MEARELFLLSPYRLPGQHSLALGDEESASFLNGYSALWHPAALAGAAGPPKIESAYDHENPTAGRIYAVPENPPLFLPDDWNQRVENAGAIAFFATPDRQTTFANLMEALKKSAERGTQSADGAAAAESETKSPEPEQPKKKRQSDAPWDEDEEEDEEEAAPTSPATATDTSPPAPVVTHSKLLDLPADQLSPFLGVGLGYIVIMTLFEAMEHENLLAAQDLWSDVQQAVTAITDGDAATCKSHLQAAADRLNDARNILYPVGVHIVDLGFLEEGRLDAPLPAAIDQGLPFNLIAPVAALEKLSKEQPERFAKLRELVQSEKLEICSGDYREREDTLLPLESQLWNLVKGLQVYRDLFGKELSVFARKRFGHHPQMPMLLQNAGVGRAVLVPFDNSVMPSYRTAAVNWPSPDGKQVETFTRVPHDAASPQTFFHLCHYLHKSIQQDQTATLALLHKDKPPAPWYHDWLALTQLGPVLGQWTLLSKYFPESQATDYGTAAAADDFQSDYLEERTTSQSPRPVSHFARHLRQRRRLDTSWSLAGIYRGLAGKKDTLGFADKLKAIEERLEMGEEVGEELIAVEKQVSEALAQRLQSKSADNKPGYLILNPCSFTRRVALELDGIQSPLAIEPPLRAYQIDADKTRVIADVPPLGFAWIPQAGPPGTKPFAGRLKLADKTSLRNEFFAAEIDPVTGGLRSIYDHRTSINRISQQLVYNPGSVMKAEQIEVTSSGPAMGEVVATGSLLGEHHQLLAKFKQRYRVWLGRPLLEMRLEIMPEVKPAGYPWHAYYGARFAWRDERATLLRSVNGISYVSNHRRPETPDYIEVRTGKQGTFLFFGGLPFHQRQDTRMLDAILIPEGESETVFDIAIGLDREQPIQTALGLATPVPVVQTAKGPPHVGAAGWLFHLDAPNLLLTGLRPLPEGGDGMVLRLLECSVYSGQAQFRCVRPPVDAKLVDARGNHVLTLGTSGDAAMLEVSPCDLVQLRVDFSS